MPSIDKKLDRALVKAAKEGDTEEVRNLLSNGADVSASDMDGATALMRAAWGGYKDVFELLVDNGADVNAKDLAGRCILLIAANQGHTDIVQMLLDRNADVNAEDKIGNTPLMEAADEGHINIVKALLAGGADVNARRETRGLAGVISRNYAYKEPPKPDGWTALIAAAEKGHTEIVRALLAKGADVNARVEKTGSPGMLSRNIAHNEPAMPDGWTARKGSNRIVQFLLAKGGNMIARLEKAIPPEMLSRMVATDESPVPDGWTALMSAAEKGYTEIVQALLAEGADVNARLEKGNWTAVTLAAHHNHTDIVELLKKAGGGEGEEAPQGLRALSWSKRFELIMWIIWGAGLITILSIGLGSLLIFGFMDKREVLISLAFASLFSLVWIRFVVRRFLKRPYTQTNFYFRDLRK